MKLEVTNLAYNSKHITSQQGIQVLTVDDHAIVRTGLGLLVQEIDKNAEVAHASSAAEALAIAQKKPHFDLILLDINIPDMDGLCLLPKLKAISPKAAIVVITGNEDSSLVEKALSLGAKKYLTKNTNSAIIKKTLGLIIETQQEKGFPENDPIREQQITGTHALAACFNYHQLQILECLGQGMSDKEISHAIYLPEDIIKNHITAIFDLLEVGNRTQAVVKAARYGLL